MVGGTKEVAKQRERVPEATPVKGARGWIYSTWMELEVPLSPKQTAACFEQPSSQPGRKRGSQGWHGGRRQRRATRLAHRAVGTAKPQGNKNTRSSAGMGSWCQEVLAGGRRAAVGRLRNTPQRVLEGARERHGGNSQRWGPFRGPAGSGLGQESPGLKLGLPRIVARLFLLRTG
jgi:hypothetical protein